MANVIEIRVPDIGGAEDVDVIELAVKPGDTVAVDDTLVTLESDKASMDIPSPEAGVVQALKVKVGDKVSEGTVIVMLESDVAASEKPNDKAAEQTVADKPVASQSSLQQVVVPDIGADDAVPVIEVFVKVGDQLSIEDPLLTLESEKASMDVPTPLAGTVKEVKIKVGDELKPGDLILMIETTGGAVDAAAPAPSESVAADKPAAPATKVESASVANVVGQNHGAAHAGPAVRRLANQLGADLSKVGGTGRKGRIVIEDLHKFVKGVMQQGGVAGGGLAVAAPPKVDFTKFGEVESKALSRIQKLSGKGLHRNWVTIPHITQFGEADITELEAFRKENKAAVEKKGAKLTPLVFIMKAVVNSLQAFPHFNASLDPSGEHLIMKKYFHIGVAVDTPNGLVVPVIRDVEQKNMTQLALELGEMSVKARDGKLLPKDMQGGCFTISSLGGIGGTAFTPIINAPEVAILGVSRTEIKPKYDGENFQPRLMLPLSLSYDHRVIDGADGARFIVHLTNELSDLRRMLL